jgi:hypothetical protein
VLAVEALYGPSMLREGLQRASTGLATGVISPAGLVAGVAEALRSRLPRGLALDPRACIPDRSSLEPSSANRLRARRAAYWAFLPAGTWMIRLAAAPGPSIDIQLEGGTVRPMGAHDAAERRWEARVETAAWRRLLLTARSGEPFEIERLELSPATMGEAVTNLVLGKPEVGRLVAPAGTLDDSSESIR